MVGVRRLLSFGLAWLVAAVAASVIAWQGVGLVGDQVTDRRPATFTADEIDAELAERGAEDTSPTTTPLTPAIRRRRARPRRSGGRPTGAGDPHVPPGRRVRRAALHPDGVTLEQAVPKLGFEVRYQPVEGNGWRVEFATRGAAGSKAGGTAAPASGSTTTSTTTVTTGTTAATTAATSTVVHRRPGTATAAGRSSPGPAGRGFADP